MDNLERYLGVLEERTVQTLETEQLGSREDAFTCYVLSQIATKVSAENYVVCHASIKNSAGNFLGEISAYNESVNQEVLTLFYTIYETNTSEVKVLSDSDVQYAWSRLQGFYEKAIRNAAVDMSEDDPAYEICKLIDDNKNLYKTVRFYILSNCSIKKSEPKKIRIRDKEFPLLGLWEQQELNDSQKEALDEIAEMMFKMLSQIANEEMTTILSISKRKGVFEDIKQKVSGEELRTLRNLALG